MYTDMCFFFDSLLLYANCVLPVYIINTLIDWLIAAPMAAEPGTTGILSNDHDTTVSPSTSSFHRIRVADISPLPLIAIQDKNKKWKSRTTQAADLTSSPYKKALETIVASSNRKQRVARKLVTNTKPVRHSDRNMSRKPAKKKRVEKKVKTKNSDLNDTTPCATCSVRFCDDVEAQNGQSWTECVSCNLWHHNECQGPEESFTAAFTCISCDNICIAGFDAGYLWSGHSI